MVSRVAIFCTIYILSLVSGDIGPSVVVSNNLGTREKQQLKQFFRHATADGSKDPSKLYHVTLGLIAFGEKVEDPKEACRILSVPLKSPDIAYFHTYCIKRLQLRDCQISVQELKKLADTHLKGNPAVEDLFYTVMAMNEAELEYDRKVVADLLEKARTKSASNPTALAMIFQAAATLNLSKSSLVPYLTTVKDVLLQADELDGQQLFFDKGMYTTAMVAQGIFDLIAANGGIGPIPEQKLVKLINFLLKRVNSNNLRAAAHLVSTLKNLDTNPHIAPVVITSGLQSASGGLLHRQKPDVQVSLTNIWGDVTYSTDKLTLEAAGLYAAKTSNKMRTLVGPEKRGSFKSHSASTYKLSLVGSDGSLPAAGKYELEVSGQWTNVAEKRTLLGLTRVQLPLTVVTNPKVVDAAATLLDAVHEHHISDLKLQPGQLYTATTSDGAVNLEYGHQLLINLRLVDELDTNIPLTAHQVFLQLTHKDTEQTITFVFDEISAVGISGAKAYQLRLDPERSADEFDNLDGIYKMELLVGDVLLQKPLLWHIANVHLHFIGPAHSDSNKRTAAALDVSRQRSPSTAGMKRASGPSSLIGTGPTKAKPEIEHMFRPAEKRAPRPLSWAFTVACAIPLIGLLVVWGILGFNLRTFQFGFSNILFHCGLIAIFCLYYVYWCRLTMFTTLGYLVLLGIPTFLAGNRVLRAQVLARHATATAGPTKKG